MPKTAKKHRWQDFFQLSTWPFWACHVVAIAGVVALGWSWSGVVLAVALYSVRMFFVTGAYHRYFSHRTFRTSRWFQFVLGLGATTCVQKGPLWWAANHRHHHKHSDDPQDIHSPRQQGFWWSHVGWVAARDHDSTLWHKIRDFSKYRELRWLNRYHLVPGIALAVGLYLLGGWHALVWGFFVSTVILWHGTFTINSLSHVFGRRRYETTDDSKNNFLLALITFGEGWHNNHHYYQRAANQGFRWYEIDITYYVLRILSWVGLVWDVHKAPRHIVENQPKATRKALAQAA